VVSESVSDDDVVPAFTTRRERRAAERLALSQAAEAAPEVASGSEVRPAPIESPIPPAVPIAFDAPNSFDAAIAFHSPIEDAALEPVEPGPQPTEPADTAAAAPKPTAHVAPAKRRKAPRRSVGRALYSTGAMAFAAALAVGMTLPSNVFGTAAPVVASELPANLNAPVEAKQALDVADTVIAAEAPGARDDYSGQTFAEAERARYQASGQGFAPGFIPTAGAIRWPFDHSVPITSGFGYSAEYGGYHSGIDFIPGPGAPISAIADGVVLWVGWDNTGYGYYIKIQSQVGDHQIIAIYAHMIDNSAQMYPGQLIKVGDFVGLTGDTGIAYGAHLHLGIEQDGVLIDPFQWLTENATDTAAE